MSRRLREIAARRLTLALLSKYARRDIADNQLWSSGPLLIAELILDVGGRQLKKANRK